MRDPRTFDDHIAPIERKHRNLPPNKRRSAVLLSYRIDDRKVAYIYDVHVGTLQRWRRTIRL